MQIEVKTTINAPREAVWARATDIAHAPEFISGLDSAEVLEQPESGLVGLKWRETRTLMGKQSTETMWVTAAKAPDYYDVEAGSHGCRYFSRLSFDDVGGATELKMTFSAEPESFMAKVLGNTIGRLFMGPTRKAFQQDLDDIKMAAERDSNAAETA